MLQNHVFIPSRGRWESARKLADVWHTQEFTTHFVVEPDEVAKYTLHRNDLNVFVHPLPRPNQGIAASRRHCVDIAASLGCKTMILADDDIKPSERRPANMQKLLECAKHKKVLGITARYSYHDLCLGDQIANRDDLILLPSGTFRLVALNVDNVISIGNYDRDLEYAEDCDLFLRGLKAGYPWMVHLGTWANSIGTRYQPGGMLDYVGDEDLQYKKLLWHHDLYNKYPEVINDPAKVKNWSKQNTIIIQWKRAYDLWLPGWRRWSMLDGGYLWYYLNENATI